MSRILVTGAGGFVGGRIAEALATDGHRVIATWRSRPVTAAAAAAVRLDLSDPRAVADLFSGPRFDAVIHAAARLGADPGPDAVAALAADNVTATATLAAAAQAAGCRRFVSLSSIAVYGGRGAPRGGYREAHAEPSEPYGWSKLAAERIFDVVATPRGSMSAVSLRLAGVHGAGRAGGALHAMCAAALAGKPIAVAEPESRFRWLWIDDAVQVARLALGADLPPGNCVINAASADAIRLRRLAVRIRDLAGSASAIRVEGTGARREEVMNIDRARRLLGFTPTRLAAALPRYLAALRAGSA